MRMACGPVVLLALSAWGGTALAAEAVVGQPAPEFSLTDTRGEARAVSDFRGDFVVLEWFNNECPFVRKHYDSGNMQALQADAATAGTSWLTIVSSAPGKQGHIAADEANAIIESRGAKQTALLLDPEGAVGRLYGAKTTPHMFVLDPDGIVIYAGAIDDRASTDPADIPGATNYVRQALAQARAGKPVAVPTSRPYGCSVKY